MFNAQIPKLGKTWIEKEGVVCGAQPNEMGPIGGGAGYQNQIEPRNQTIRTLDELIDGLREAQSGDTLYLDGGAEIDCTERIYIEQLVLEVPGGVTVASNRGQGASQGALIFSDCLRTRPLFRAMGPKVRFSGLRIAGPNPKRCLEHHRRSFGVEPPWKGGLGRDYYYKFPVSDGIETCHANLTVDNCELGGWSHAAIYLKEGTGHHIHHNSIHHNQYNGLGYGVSHDRAFSLIEYNLFNFNRHSIAGTGNPGSGYEACHNVELGESLSHCFDMHGGADRKDGTNIAGTWMKVHHNSFGSQETALVVRGEPDEGIRVESNWFYHRSEEEAIRIGGWDDAVISLVKEKLQSKNNAFGYRSERG